MKIKKAKTEDKEEEEEKAMAEDKEEAFYVIAKSGRESTAKYGAD